MKVAILSTFDAQGGAARAASQLHRALRAEGADSTLLVAHRSGAGERVRQVEPRLACRALSFADEKRALRALSPYASTRPRGYDAFRPDGLLLGRLVEQRVPAADLVNLHWVAGMLASDSVARLASRTQVVWTLHDMLPMTGGCHYDDGCARYLEACGACPQLGSASADDLSAATLRRKRASYGAIARARLHVVAPSRWLAAEAARSPLLGDFPRSVIPYSIDTALFAPVERGQARATLGLPVDRTVFLFASDQLASRRKGMRFLLEALAGIDCERERVLLVSIGESEIDALSGPHYRHFPYFRDNRRLATFYAAADLLVLPSLQDNLPLTLLEAMACGTAVAGFAVGGIPDALHDGETGILVPAGSVEGLRAALRRVAANPAEAHAMGARARARALAEHAPALEARRYLELFAGLLQNAGAAA